MVPRQGKRWDGTLAGNNFRLKRGDETSHRKVSRRSEGVPFQDLSGNRGQFSTRGDTRAVFQTSWSAGSFWNKPLLSEGSMDSYFDSEGIDVVSVPGDLLPLPTATTQTGQVSNITHPGASVSAGSDIFAVGAAVSTNATVRKWSGSSWSTFTNEFPIAATTPTCLFYDRNQDTLVQLVPDGNLDYVDRGDGSNGSIIDVGTIFEGANAFMHNGRMFVYTGDLLLEVTDAYGSPATATITDDGMGTDYLNFVSTSAAVNDRLVYRNRLAVATAEGIYYVKNVEQEGLPTAFIYRVDRSNDGTDIATPVATLPPGVIALDVGWHLGSLMISATSDIDLVMKNDLTSSVYPRIDIYHLTNNQLGTIGSPLGGESPDEAPYRFAGTFGAKVYIGGQKRVWVYDAVRGGLHPLFTHFQTGLFGSAVVRAYATTDSSANRVLRFIDGEFNYFDLEIDTGTANDSQTREIESNYFDFNIPAEQKTITHVTFMTDGPTANETWTIQLSTDDSAFATVATHTASQSNTQKQRLSTVKTGFRFRYKIQYATSATTASPSRVKGIVFHCLQGEMVTTWFLRIDGTEFTNVENLKVRPDDVLSYLETIAGTATVVAYVDEYKTSSSSHNVKVESVDINRSSPQEIDFAQVVLTEDT